MNNGEKKFTDGTTQKNGKVPKEVIMLPWNGMNDEKDREKTVRQYNRKLGEYSAHSVEFGVFSALDSYAIQYQVMATSQVHCTGTSAK